MLENNIPKELKNRKIFKYDDMNNEKWEEYRNLQKKFFEENFNTTRLDTSQSRDIETSWSNIKKTIKNSTSIIPIEEKKLYIGKRNPLYGSHSYNVRKYIIALCRKIKKQGRKCQEVINSWENFRKYLTYCSTRVNLTEDWRIKPNSEDNRKKLVEKLILLKEKYDKIFIKDHNAYKESKINAAIDRRCNDLMDNQKRLINNITNKEFKAIVIDRILTKNESGEYELITEPEKIKEETVKHFKTVAGSKNSIKEINGIWEKQYSPKEEISYNIYDNILELITLEELKNEIHDLPNNKATGPTGVSYEMLKQSDDMILIQIVSLFNTILDKGEIPSDWKNADIYPIPKPKPWGFQLNNTRPITLLETSRKLLGKILNRRLSRVLREHKILKGNQFAGLEGCSTFEPLRIINELIQDANEENKEMWLLALDMSKAYDRVNIFMLEKAMERIKIPSKFIKIIKEFFIRRKNRVFTAVGLTDYYNVDVGIDQGEIISPLLWCIYYDPLLTELKERSLGYKISGKRILNIYENIYEEVSLYCPGLAYMDDTNFISKNKKELEQILDIADSFYRLNDIKINKDKSELLLRPKNKRFNLSVEIEIKFGNNITMIKPTQKHQNIRILGCWFNAFNKRDYVKNQIKDEIISINDKILKKRNITDKMSAYIFNTCIIPRIEYRSQLVIFSNEECNKFMIPYRRTFKNKLKFAKTAPNVIVHSNLLYNIKSILDNQSEAKINNFFIQLNNQEMLGKIMYIRLLNLQRIIWATESPIFQNNFSWKEFKQHIPKIKYNFIVNNLELLEKNQISIKKRKKTNYKKFKNNWRREENYRLCG